MPLTIIKGYILIFACLAIFQICLLVFELMCKYFEISFKFYFPRDAKRTLCI